jgi:hypothetical protein
MSHSNRNEICPQCFERCCTQAPPSALAGSTVLIGRSSRSTIFNRRSHVREPQFHPPRRERSCDKLLRTYGFMRSLTHSVNAAPKPPTDAPPTSCDLDGAQVPVQELWCRLGCSTGMAIPTPAGKKLSCFCQARRPIEGKDGTTMYLPAVG